VVALALLSMAGIPPLAGFFGKYYLLLHAQGQELYGLVLVALATSLTSTYYYLRLIKIFWFENNVGVRSVSFNLTRVQEGLIFVSGIFLSTFITFFVKLIGFFDVLIARVLGWSSVSSVFTIYQQRNGLIV